MKYSLECEVESKTKISKQIQIVHENKTYIFHPDEKGILKRIKIISEVREPEKFYSKIEPSQEKNVKAHISIKRDRDLYRSVISEFQVLESELAFSANLKKIKWENPKEDLIFETEEEKEKAKIFGINFQRNYPDPIKILDENSLKEIITTKAKYASLIIPKSFWREGLNEYKSFRYINAFYNFYFILEGLYGNGKTKNCDVAREFKKSKEFRDFTESTIEALNKNIEHKNKIIEMLKYRKKQLDVDGIIDLLERTRGELHHFVNNPHKIEGTPFTHEEFASIAFVAFSSAIHAILYEIVKINRGKT